MRDAFDEEIRGHLAISIKERIERGEDPESARLAALKEFGNVTLTCEAMRAASLPRWFDAAEALAHDIRFAFRSLARERARGHGRRDARARHRRQCRDLQRRARGASTSARQP
jgi:hypothetical protein